MKHILSILALLFLIGCTPVKENQEPTFGIVIHGGAGTIFKENISPQHKTLTSYNLTSYSFYIFNGGRHGGLMLKVS